MVSSNSDLQRLNAALTTDLEKYVEWAKHDGVSDLIKRVDHLQDALFQQREVTDIHSLARAQQ